MQIAEYFEPVIFQWVILPILICLARILDVSIGTIRLIFLSKGFRILAPVLGFFEIFIWILVVAQVMNQGDNIMCYFAYALGFAIGNYIGISIVEKLAIGTVEIRIIPQKDTTALSNYLRSNNFGVSTMDIEGMTGKLKMIITIVKRKELQNIIEIINRFNPAAFYTISDIRNVREGFFESKKANFAPSVFSLFRWRFFKNP